MGKPISIPIDGTLDLHTFSTKDIYSLMDEYISECLSKNIHQIRIIHGKGKGIKRAVVHKLLESDPRVESFFLDSGFSGWGATIAFLKGENEN